MSEKINALKFEKIKGIIHPALIKSMAAKTTGELVVDGEAPSFGNYLIVANHVCIEDIPTLGQALKDRHFYLLVSDEDRYTIDGLGLELNGVEWVKRVDKDSRKKAYANIVEALKRGKDFAMYPESTWNLSPNQLLLPMNYGCIRMALDAGVKILPVVTFFEGNKRYTKIGEPFEPTADLASSINDLRDTMGTMLLSQIEKSYKEQSNDFAISDSNYYPYEKRVEIKPGYWDKYIYDKYASYKRAKKDMAGVRNFESQFIFTPKTDDHQFFQTFNSVVKDDNEIGERVSRISSEKSGYSGSTFGEENKKSSFGYGYNEHVLKKVKK